MEVQLIESKPHILRWHISRQENVYSFSDTIWHRDNAISARLAIEAANVVREIVKNGEVMFNHNDVLLYFKHAANHAGCIESLLHIKVGTWLIEEIDICLLKASLSDDESL